MFPFGGLLTSINFDLLMPGQDSPQLYVKVGTGGSAHSGFRLNDNGLSETWGPGFQQSPQPALLNSWIHSDALGVFDLNQYEWFCNKISGDPVLGSPTDATWRAFSTDPNPQWYVQALGLFNVDEARIVVGVRQIGNPASTRAGQIDLRAIEIGL